MSNLTNPPGGGDLPDRFRNVGEQIQSFFDFAENNPDRAVPFFVNIWETQASLTTRALALQGLGVSAKHYHVKEALADWDVLRDIAKEVKGKGEVSNDLTRWAAASALEAIGYSQQSLQHLEGGGFTEPLDRIRREIRDRKLAEINRIPRLNTRGETTAEYERHLEFWLYGPADELLNDNDRSLKYQDLIGDVISKLHGRGVFLGLLSPNSIVQGAALRQAGLIFKESAEIEEYLYGLLEEFLHDSNHETSLRINAADIINTARDLNRRLKTLSKLLLEENNPKLQEVALRQSQSVFQQSVEIEEYLYGLLEEFLHNSNHETSLRIHAAEIINTARDLNRRLKTLSKLLLEENNPKLQEVALRQSQSVFQRSAEIEEFIYGLLEEFLHNSNHETSLRIHAAEIINTARDLNRRLKTLSKLFLDKAELRNAAVRLLTPYKQELARIEPDADTVLDALVFNYSLDTLQKPQLQDLTISQLETYFPSASQYHREISAIFPSAIAASESLARRYGRSVSVLKQFLQNKQDEYLSAIESWLSVLKNQISEMEPENRKIKFNQALINETINFMENGSAGTFTIFLDKGEKNNPIENFLFPFPIPEKVCVIDKKILLSSTDFYTSNQSYQIKSDLRSIKFYLLKFLINEEKNTKSGLGDEPWGCLWFFPLLFLVPFLYGWVWLGVILIVLAGVVMTSMIIEYQKKEKKLNDIQSIINKLNTQWKE